MNIPPRIRSRRSTNCDQFPLRSAQQSRLWLKQNLYPLDFRSSGALIAVILIAALNCFFALKKFWCFGSSFPSTIVNKSSRKYDTFNNNLFWFWRIFLWIRTRREFMDTNTLIEWFIQTHNKINAEEIICYLLVPLLIVT